MIREFEGKNEEDAIKRALESLGLDKDDVEIEIIKNVKSGFLFRGGKVKIRVHYGEEDDFSEGDANNYDETETDEFSKRIVEFLSGLFKRMGIDVDIRVYKPEENKYEFDIDSDESGIVIGKQGKTLEAIQLITNIVASRFGEENIKIILDIEDYRKRREKNIERIAKRIASQVRRSKGSRLLEPMNPFERRIVHTALSKYEDIETISEGEGLYKQVRILYRGKHHY